LIGSWSLRMVYFPRPKWVTSNGFVSIYMGKLDKQDKQLKATLELESQRQEVNLLYNVHFTNLAAQNAAKRMTKYHPPNSLSSNARSFCS